MKKTVKRILSHTIQGLFMVNGIVVILGEGSNMQLTEYASAGQENFVYPVKQVSTLECRTKHRSTLDANCKIDLPIVKGSRYSDYKDSKIHHDIYTTLWGATYNDGRDSLSGSHPGIDIASAPGTPVYSIGEGIVYYVGTNSAYGNVIKVKHRRGNENIYSIYAHLEKIEVTTGQVVAAGTRIGTIGNSGRVFGQMGGYHLNFEIQKESFGRPAYFFKDCKDLSQGEVFAINNGLCRDELNRNSYDPIAFLESYNTQAINTVQTPKIETTVDKALTTKPTTEKETVKQEISKTTVNKEIELTYKGDSARRKDFMKKWKIKAQLSNNKLNIYAVSYDNTKRYAGILPGQVTITSKNPKLLGNQTAISIIGRNGANIELSSLGGNQEIIIMIDSKTSGLVSMGNSMIQ